MKNKDLIIYRVSTGLLTLMMLFGASMYLLQYDLASDMFTKLGFPLFIIYPLAIAKYLGLIAIWSNKSKLLKEWAYAGFFFELSIATGAHIIAADGEYYFTILLIAIVLISRFYHGKMEEKSA